MIPKLHLVTDDEILSRPGLLAMAGEILRVGRGALSFHLRGPGTPGRVLFSLGESLAPLAEATGSVLIVNDRVDLTLALDLPGVHLGQRSLPPAVARGLLGPRRVLGLSVHGLQEVEEGVDDTLDYLILGTIFPTGSHPERAPGGLNRIRDVAALTRLPLVAIGGVTPRRVAEVLGAGAHGVAVKGGIWDAEDPIAAARGYLMELEKGTGHDG